MTNCMITNHTKEIKVKLKSQENVVQSRSPTISPYTVWHRSSPNYFCDEMIIFIRWIDMKEFNKNAYNSFNMYLCVQLYYSKTYLFSDCFGFALLRVINLWLAKTSRAILSTSKKWHQKQSWFDSTRFPAFGAGWLVH